MLVFKICAIFKSDNSENENVLASKKTVVLGRVLTA